MAGSSSPSGPFSSLLFGSDSSSSTSSTEFLAISTDDTPAITSSSSSFSSSQSQSQSQTQSIPSPPHESPSVTSVTTGSDTTTNPTTTTTTAPDASTATNTSSSSAAADSALPSGFDSRASGRVSPYSFFSTPAPLRALFAHFPLKTYPAELRPASCLPSAQLSAEQSINLELWIRGPDSTKQSRLQKSTATPSWTASCDPDSLAVQALMLAQHISFNVRVAPSADAAPDGKLPFILATSVDQIRGKSRTSRGTGTRSKKTRTSVIKRGEIEQFIALRVKARQTEQQSTHGDDQEETNSRPENAESQRREVLGLSLVATRIRPAWLWAAYLTPENFETVIAPDYVVPAVGQRSAYGGLAYSTLLAELVASATQELVATAGAVTVAQLAAVSASVEVPRQVGEAIYSRAGAALATLSELLGDDDYFGGTRPGRLDAVVFAYTFLLVGTVTASTGTAAATATSTTTQGDDGDTEGLLSSRWVDTALPHEFRKHARIMQHAQRMHRFLL